MKRPFIRALILGLIFVLVYNVIKIIHGMYLTMNYVPDIVNSYKSVVYLQHEITFGQVSSPVWRMIGVFGMMLLGVVFYYTVRKLRKSSLKRQK